MLPIIALALNLQAIAAGTAEERNIGIPGSGEWYLESAVFVPSTTSAIDATNTATITLKFGTGGSTIATLTNGTVAFTKGTARAFDLSSVAASLREFSAGAGTDTLEAAVSHAASGSVVDGTITLIFSKMARDAAG